jgi:hypothetical protein
MPSSLPQAPDLVAVVREFLERDILPGLAGEQWFNLKVALNLLATVERELRQGAACDEAEAARLAALVGAEGTLEERNRRLALAIRDGEFPRDDPDLLDHLRTTLADALAINNPRWSRG